MEITFSNIDNRKQKKKNFVYIMPGYLLPHIHKKKYIYIKNDDFNPHPHIEGTLINLYMNEKKNYLGGSP